MAGRYFVPAIFWTFLAVVLVAPLPYGAAHLWSYSLLALIVGILIVLWALVSLFETEAYAIRMDRIGYVVLPLAAVFAWIALQSWPGVPAALLHPFWTDARAALGDAVAGTISLDPQATLIGLMRMASYAGIFWLAVQLCRDGRHAYIALWAIAAAGFGYSVYGLWVYLSGSNTILFAEKWAYQGMLTGTFVNRNHYAFYAGLGLIASFGLFLRYAHRDASGAFDSSRGFLYALERLTLPVFILFAGCIVIGTALVLTQSRGGVAWAFAGLIAVTLMVSAGAENGIGIRRRTAVILMAGLAVAGIAIVAISGEKLLLRLTSPAEDSRAAIHALTRDAIAAAPLTGHGVGTFPSLFHLFRDEAFSPLSPAYAAAHSVYLEFAAETGLIAAALYFGALGLIVATCILGVWRRRRHIVFPAVGAACGIHAALHSIYDFGPQIPGAAVTLAAVLGIGYAQSWPTADHGDR